MKTQKEIDDFIKNNYHLSYQVLADKIGISKGKVKEIYRKLELPPKTINKKKLTEEQIQQDIKSYFSKVEKISTDKKYKFLLAKTEQLTKELHAALEIKNNIRPHKIVQKIITGNTEATAVVLASDWHIEERVIRARVNGLNEYSIPIARQRCREFFQNTLRLVEKERHAVKIDTLVLALLGDFISGNIHDELLENCSLQPIDAMIEAQNIIISGIKFLLDNSDLKLVIPCHVGNHTRITKKVHISTENGNSMETFMYLNMKNYFKNNKRVKFLISEGYHSYLKIYDFTIRFHHGHQMQYGGGIGGIFIPAFKAISQWNKGQHADLDCFGHFHNRKDGGNFLLNGSIIGHSAYAISIKCDYEKPMQTFFLIDKKRGKTMVTPICFKI